MAGGTNMYYPVESADSLESAFRTITKDVVKCEFDLTDPPEDPTYVLLTIDKKQIPYNDPNGWTLVGNHVTLQGTACSSLKDGQVHDLKATVQCTVVTLK
jgi:hypothetical protein